MASALNSQLFHAIHTCEITDSVVFRFRWVGVVILFIYLSCLHFLELKVPQAYGAIRS